MAADLRYGLAGEPSRDADGRWSFGRQVEDGSDAGSGGVSGAFRLIGRLKECANFSAPVANDDNGDPIPVRLPRLLPGVPEERQFQYDNPGVGVPHALFRSFVREDHRLGRADEERGQIRGALIARGKAKLPNNHTLDCVAAVNTFDAFHLHVTVLQTRTINYEVQSSDGSARPAMASGSIPGRARGLTTVRQLPDPIRQIEFARNDASYCLGCRTDKEIHIFRVLSRGSKVIVRPTTIISSDDLAFERPVAIAMDSRGIDRVAIVTHTGTVTLWDSGFSRALDKGGTSHRRNPVIVNLLASPSSATHLRWRGVCWHPNHTQSIVVNSHASVRVVTFLGQNDGGEDDIQRRRIFDARSGERILSVQCKPHPTSIRDRAKYCILTTERVLLYTDVEQPAESTSMRARCLVSWQHDCRPAGLRAVSIALKGCTGHLILLHSSLSGEILVLRHQTDKDRDNPGAISAPTRVSLGHKMVCGLSFFSQCASTSPEGDTHVGTDTIGLLAFDQESSLTSITLSDARSISVTRRGRRLGIVHGAEQVDEDELSDLVSEEERQLPSRSEADLDMQDDALEDEAAADTEAVTTVQALPVAGYVSDLSPLYDILRPPQPNDIVEPYDDALRNMLEPSSTSGDGQAGSGSVLQTLYERAVGQIGAVGAIEPYLLDRAIEGAVESWTAAGRQVATVPGLRLVLPNGLVGPDGTPTDDLSATNIMDGLRPWLGSTTDEDEQRLRLNMVTPRQVRTLAIREAAAYLSLSATLVLPRVKDEQSTSDDQMYEAEPKLTQYVFGASVKPLEPPAALQRLLDDWQVGADVGTYVWRPPSAVAQAIEEQAAQLAAPAQTPARRLAQAQREDSQFVTPALGVPEIRRHDDPSRLQADTSFFGTAASQPAVRRPFNTPLPGTSLRQAPSQPRRAFDSPFAASQQRAFGGTPATASRHQTRPSQPTQRQPSQLSQHQLPVASQEAGDADWSNVTMSQVLPGAFGMRLRDTPGRADGTPSKRKRRAGF